MRGCFAIVAIVVAGGSWAEKTKSKSKRMEASVSDRKGVVGGDGKKRREEEKNKGREGMWGGRYSRATIIGGMGITILSNVMDRCCG